MEMFQCITLVIAILGLTLSLLNTCTLVRSKSVRLRLSLLLGYANDAEKYLCIEIINLSEFPVTIVNVGFLSPTTKKKKQGLYIKNPDTTKGKLPMKLEPRDSMCVLIDPIRVKSKDFQEVKNIYAVTACGITKKGNRNLKCLVKKCRQSPQSANLSELIE